MHILTRIVAIASVVFVPAMMGQYSACYAEEVALVVAATSMHSVTDKEANLQVVRTLIAEAAAAGAHLVVLPLHAVQQANPGRDDAPTDEELAVVRQQAEPIPGPITAWLEERAREERIYVVLGMTEQGDDGRLYLTSVLVGPEGLLAAYRTRSLLGQVQGANENRVYSVGTDEDGLVVDTPLGRIGLMVNFDLFQKVGLLLVGRGAQLLVTVAAWSEEFSSYYHEYTGINAESSGLWHVAANQFGTNGTHGYINCGHSKIVDPSGEVIGETGAEQGMVIAEVGLMIDPAVLGRTGTAVQPGSWANVKATRGATDHR